MGPSRPSPGRSGASAKSTPALEAGDTRTEGAEGLSFSLPHFPAPQPRRRGKGGQIHPGILEAHTLPPPSLLVSQQATGGPSPRGRAGSPAGGAASSGPATSPTEPPAHPTRRRKADGDARGARTGKWRRTDSSRFPFSPAHARPGTRTTRRRRRTASFLRRARRQSWGESEGGRGGGLVGRGGVAVFLAPCQSQTGGTGSGSPVARVFTAEGRAGRLAVSRALRPGDEGWSGVAALGQTGAVPGGSPAVDHRLVRCCLRTCDLLARERAPPSRSGIRRRFLLGVLNDGFFKFNDRPPWPSRALNILF